MLEQHHRDPHQRQALVNQRARLEVRRSDLFPTLAALELTDAKTIRKQRGRLQAETNEPLPLSVLEGGNEHAFKA